MSEIVLKIYTEDEKLKDLYKNHGHFHPGDIGIDLFCPKQIDIPPKNLMIDFDIKCEIIEKDVVGASIKNLPYMLIPRSSICKTPLIMHNSVGIIDAGYRGKLKAPVYNTSKKFYIIKEYQRLFQLVLFGGQPITKIEVIDSLSKSKRGSAGFGSTGI